MRRYFLAASIAILASVTNPSEARVDPTAPSPSEIPDTRLSPKEAFEACDIKHTYEEVNKGLDFYFIAKRHHNSVYLQNVPVCG